MAPVTASEARWKRGHLGPQRHRPQHGGRGRGGGRRGRHRVLAVDLDGEDRRRRPRRRRRRRRELRARVRVRRRARSGCCRRSSPSMGVALENARLFDETQRLLRESRAAGARADRVARLPDRDQRRAARHQPVADRRARRCSRRSSAARRGCSAAPSRRSTATTAALVDLAATRNWPAEALALAHVALPGAAPTGAAGRPRHPVGAGRSADRRRAHRSVVRPRFAAAGSWRRVMGAPMLKDGVAVGAILVGWPDAGRDADAPDRAAPDLRRPGGDRDRERAPVQRDQGGAASSRPRRPRSCASSAARRPTCSRCSTRSLDSAHAPVRRRRARRCCWSTARLCTSPGRGVRRRARDAAMRAASRCRSSSGSASGRAIARAARRARSRTSLADPEYAPSAESERQLAGYRAMPVAPMLRDGVAIGAHRRVARRAGRRSPTSRSRCCRPSPTRR